MGKEYRFITSVGIGIYLSGSGWDLDDHMAAIRGMLGFTRSKSGKERAPRWKEKTNNNLCWADRTGDVCPWLEGSAVWEEQEKAQRDVVMGQPCKFKQTLNCVVCKAISQSVNTRLCSTPYSLSGIWRPRPWRASKRTKEYIQQIWFQGQALTNWLGSWDMQENTESRNL